MDNIKKCFKYLGITLLLFLLHIIFPTYIMSNIKKLNFIYIDNKFVFTIVAITTYLIELALFSFIFRKKLINSADKDLKNDFKYHFKLWLIGLMLMILFNVIINILLFKGSTATNEALNRKYLSKYPIYSIFSILLYAPFCEELIFRCSLKRGFKYCITFAFCSGILFGGIHIFETLLTVNNTSEFINQLLYIFPYGALGFSFAYAYFKTDNIIADILTHFMHNLFVLLLLIIF